MLSTGLVAIDATILATAVPAIVATSAGFTPVPVAVLGLPARAGRLGADLRQARRPRRPQAGDARRHRAVPGRLAAVRAGVEHGRADRVPRAAGPRRRRGAADRHDDRRRHLLGRRARQGAGLHRQRLGDLLASSGPTLGGVFADYALLALDLLRQPAARRWSRRGCCGAGSTSAVERTRAARPRSTTLGAVLLARRRAWLLLARAARGRRARGRGPRRRASALLAGSRCCCSWRSCSSSGGPPSRCCRCGSSGTGWSARPWRPRSWSACCCSGLTSYVPLFAQGVLGPAPIVAGFALAAMTIGWPIAATHVGAALPAVRLPHDDADRRRSSRVAGAALLLTVDAASSVCTSPRRAS